MYKRGTIQTVVGISVILIFLAVAFLAFYSPEGLAPKIAAGAEWIADKALGGSREEKFEKKALQVDPAVKAAYEDIVKKLGDQGKGPCILRHTAFPKDFNDFTISLTEVPDGIFAEVINKKGQKPFSTTIAGKVPCVVWEEGAKNFINNHLDGSKCTSNCPLDYWNVSSITFTDRSHIYVDGDKKDIEEGNLLFKNRDGDVCFFQKDDYDKNKIQNNLRECGTVRPELPSIPIPDSGIGAYYQIDVDGIKISWTEPLDGFYALKLKQGDRELFNSVFHDHAQVLFSQYDLDGKETLTGQFIKYGPDDKFVENYQEFTIDLTQEPSLSSEPLPGFPKDKWNVIWYDDPKNNGFTQSNRLGSKYREYLFTGESLSDFKKDFGKKVLAYEKKDHIGLQAKSSICFEKGDKIKFNLGSDDGSRLYMDGELEIGNWGDHDYSVKSFVRVFSLNACHSFLIEYYENKGNARIHFGWHYIST